MSLSIQPNQTDEQQSIGQLARRLYTTGPLAARLLQHHRHRICPFHTITTHIPSNASVLDIGCGSGLLIAILASTRNISSAHGIDASPQAIQLANTMLTNLKNTHPLPEITFEHRTIQQGLPDRQYDAVCLVDVLHHVPPDDQQQAFMQAAQQVKPGGTLVYKDMATAPRWAAAMNRLHDLVLVRQWINYVQINTVESWARHAGLTPTHAHETRILWYAHQLRIFTRGAAHEQ